MLRKSFVIVCATAFAYIVLFPQAVAKNIDAIIHSPSKLASSGHDKSSHVSKAQTRKKVAKKTHGKKTTRACRNKPPKQKAERVEQKQSIKMGSSNPTDEKLIASKKGDAIPDIGADDLDD